MDNFHLGPELWIGHDALRMAISFVRLHFAEPSALARRLLWHILSIGTVSRDEPERHAGLDKAGLFLFRVVAGQGQLEMMGKCHALVRGPCCWLVDLRQARSYLPAAGKVLRTEGVRFSGPGVESWLDLIGNDPAFRLPPGALRQRLGRLESLAQRRPPRHEWEIHCELTALWGELLTLRSIFSRSEMAVPAPVIRVLEAVSSDPARAWQAQELAGVAGVSYSRLRAHFLASRGETLHTFLQRTRLDLARQLLSDQRLAVKEVAQRLNFSSEFYFSRFFHRSAGMSPKQFRKHCRA